MRKQSPRLHFTEEERTAPELQKPIRKAEKAADRAEKAHSKIPQKKVKTRTVDPKMGKVTTVLQFEEKKPPSKLTHAVREAPVNVLSGQFHREMSESENDNVGVESAHKLETGAEATARFAENSHRAQKLKPYRAAQRADSKLDKANLDALYKKAELENPSSNPYSKWQQKQAIKRQYAAAKSGKTAETTKKTAEKAGEAAKKAAEEAKKAAEYVWAHKKGFAIAIAIVLMLAFLLNGLSSCSVFMQAGTSAVAASTYPCEDADMLGAENAYCALEAELQEMLDSYEDTHDYDEYHFELDDIEHDPYVLISCITALKGGEWTLSEVQDTMQMLFEKQYILTETVTEETRYRTERRTGTRTVTDPETGETSTESYSYTVQVPYTYYICTVELENFNLSHVPIYIMGEDQLSMYALYMAVLGNRPDLFPSSEYVGKYINGSYTDYDIPAEALEDEQFAAMIKEAEKYLGYPYVWGGSSPSTSFDCSGFVSWVCNNCGVGWNFGRLGAQGLCNICTRTTSPKPGDLVFFEGTYDTDGVSHCAIYVGNNMMIHCGDPIQYANLNSSYWQQHFYCYGRLPQP